MNTNAEERGADAGGRAGYTIVELLMVVSVVAVLLGLILPALSAGRVAASRVACLNNMRQLGLAFGTYDSSARSLPSGVVNPTGPVHNRPDDLHVSWVTQILPFMEQQGLYRAADFEVSVYAVENVTTRSARINSLVCPGEKEAVKRVTGFGVTSYAGCSHDVEAPIDAGNHGMLFLNSRTSLANIPDGGSYTILVAEKSVDPVDLGWMSGTRATLRTTGWGVNAADAPKFTLAPGKDKTDPEDLRVGGFSSSHAGGMNALFGDSSVRFVRQSVAPEVLRRLGHRRDGELVEPGSY